MLLDISPTFASEGGSVFKLPLPAVSHTVAEIEKGVLATPRTCAGGRAGQTLLTAV